MSDLIERKAAIEAFEKDIMGGLNWDYILSNLPSAQPCKQTCKSMYADVSDLVSRQAALDCFHDWIDKHGDIHTPDEMAEYRAIEALPSAQPEQLGTNLAEVGTDCISRQAAIDVIFSEPLYKPGMKKRDVDVVVPVIYEKIKSLPSAQPELSDEEKRLIKQLRSYHNGAYAKVIDRLVASAQPEPCEDAVGRDAVARFLDDWISALDANCHHQSMADLKIVKNDFKNLPSAQPMRKRGRWILDRSGAYCCSECMEPCAGYIMMKPRDKFCKMCGAKMEGDADDTVQ